MIQTERLILRPITATDLHAFQAILSDTHVMRYWSSLPHADLETTREWLEREMAITPDEGFTLAIEHQGRMIGKVGAHRLPEIGYVLAREAWGRGFAGEALAAIIAHLFATTALPRLTADVDPRNEASLRLLARLGFAETHRAARTWQIGEEWCDSVYLALERAASPAG